jgi:LCP family protein required for cell wall assembly
MLMATGLTGVALLTAFLFLGPLAMVSHLADPDVLLGLVLFNIVVAVVRLFSTTHAWRVGGGRKWIVAVILAVFVAVPHVALGWVGLETRDSLLTVFAPETPTPVLTVAETSTSSTTTTTLFHLDPLPGGPAEGEYGEDKIVRPEPILWRPFGEERLNLLILGGDAGPGRSGLRTDTMIIASVNPVSGDAALFGLPRNFGGVAFSDGTPFPGRRLNHVYGWGVDNPGVFGGVDPGASAVIDVIENITSLDIDYFMLVDLTGFADVVDVLGGVSLDVAAPVNGPLYDPETGRYQMIEIPAGEQHLDGGRALAYARARYGSSDYVRMGRQRCIIAAMVGQAEVLSLLTRLPDLLDVVETHVTTDVPLDLVPELIRLSPRVSSQSIRVIGFDPTWSIGRTADGHAIPDVDRIRAAVRKTIESPEAAAALGVSTVAESCG